MGWAYLEVRKKTEELRSKIRVERTTAQTMEKWKKEKPKEIKGFCLGKCGKTEKTLTGNEALLPVETKHVALRGVIAATTQSMRSRIPSAITEK